MKTKIFNISAIVAIVMTVSLTACDNDDPGKYEMTLGKPEVHYVRTTNPVSADSLLVGAFMQSTIALIGENLRSVQEIWFNDQQAILNISMVTDNTLIVTVPKTIPTNVTDKIYMVTQEKDTIAHNFKVLVPSPLLGKLKCEWVAEENIAVILGDYLINDPQVPLSVVFSGNIKGEVVSANKTSAQVIVPKGALEGPITVTSRYGTTRSTFYFHDSRGIVMDMDKTTGATSWLGYGSWSPGNYSNQDPEGIDGNYLKYDFENKGWEWSGNTFMFYWGSGEDVSTLEPKNAVLKFEVNCPEAWKGVPLLIQFEPKAADRNPYLDTNIFKAAQCRWTPWENTGSYTTDGWETIEIPFTEFNKDADGNTVALTSFEGLSAVFMGFWGGMPEGVEAHHVKMCIDNLRIVPIE